MTDQEQNIAVAEWMGWRKTSRVLPEPSWQHNGREVEHCCGFS